ncbi:hypothetical protein [Streptomyces olivaceiscleroticus]|uniref:hypothetical protein n=1 Tax=Streptomyces olivaceiscleroticus TaxID=68245 RepID=UPI003D1553D3
MLAHDQEQTLLRSRHGTDLTPGFPELVAAAAQLPYDVVLDGELVHLGRWPLGLRVPGAAAEPPRGDRGASR